MRLPRLLHIQVALTISVIQVNGTEVSHAFVHDLWSSKCVSVVCRALIASELEFYFEFQKSFISSASIFCLVSVGARKRVPKQSPIMIGEAFRGCGGSKFRRVCMYVCVQCHLSQVTCRSCFCHLNCPRVRGQTFVYTYCSSLVALVCHVRVRGVQYVARVQRGASDRGGTHRRWFVTREKEI